MAKEPTLPLRSALYLPASNRRAIEKARVLAADAVIFDLEDAVAPGMKEEARKNLQEAFASGPVALGARVIRINALGSQEIDADLDAVRRCAPDAVLLPKVSSVEEITLVAQRLGERGGAPAIWCMVETAQGLQDIAKLAAASSQQALPLQCLVLGTNDIARETGVTCGEGRRYLLPWLMSAVLAAKANGLTILDGVWNDFKDMEGFELEASQGRNMGFDGKTLIHPTQIERCNGVFSPSTEALEEARAIVAAFEEPAHREQSVINLNGRMVERLHLDMAQRTLRTDQIIRRRLDAARQASA